MTEKLYYHDSRLQSFQARLLRQERQGRRWIAVLDRSAFYPQGGGQPADRGSLNGVFVLDVQDRGGEILHVLPQPLQEGLPVAGTIDFARRFEFMQQHTGQHIVSASLIQAAGYPTVSAHLGEHYTAVEIKADKIEEEQIETAERLANRAVTRNLPVRIQWIRPEEAERFKLRKPPPEVGRLRIVEIEGVDAAACAGIHVASTGEVGLIKYDGLEKIRGRLRLHWLIGERAYRDNREKDRLIAALNRELTCGTSEILASVQELKNRLRARGEQLSRLERDLSARIAAELLDRSDSLGPVRLAAEIFQGVEPSLASAVYQALLSRPSTVAFIFNRTVEDVRWWIGSSEDLELPWKRIVPPLLPLIDGKGGGRGASWQGSGRKPQGTPEFLTRLQEALQRHLPEHRARPEEG